MPIYNERVEIMTCRIEEYPTKLFIHDVEFNEHTHWDEVKDLFAHDHFISNRAETKITVNSIQAHLIEDGQEIKISVNFVEGSIKSASIHIPSINNDYDHTDGMDFYQQSGKRDRLYRKWLKKHMLASLNKSGDSFVLVGEDKSTNTYIVIHWNEY